MQADIFWEKIIKLKTGKEISTLPVVDRVKIVNEFRQIMNEYFVKNLKFNYGIKYAAGMQALIQNPRNKNNFHSSPEFLNAVNETYQNFLKL